MIITWFYDRRRHYYGGIFNIKSPLEESWFGVLIDDDDEFRFVGVSANFVAPEEAADSINIKKVKNKVIVKRLERLVEENKAEITKRILRSQDDTPKLSYYNKQDHYDSISGLSR